MKPLYPLNNPKTGKGFGDYQKTLKYLNECKVILALSERPYSYTQLRDERKMHSNKLASILKYLLKENIVIKHRLAGEISKEFKMGSEYYLLNFDSQIVKDCLLMKLPEFLKRSYQQTKKEVVSGDIHQKQSNVVRRMLEYFESVTPELYKDDYDENISYHELSNSIDPGLNEMIRKEPKIRAHLKELRRLEEEKSDIELESNSMIVEIYQKQFSNLEEYGLSKLDSFVLISLSLKGDVRRKYFDLWRFFKRNYKEYFTSCDIN